MKVLHIASGDLWAGAEKQLYTLLVALDKLDQVEVMAAVLNPGTLADKIRQAGINCLVLDENRQNSLAIGRAIHRFMRQYKPDLVHTHRLKENTIGGLLALWHGIPSVRTQHGSSEHSIGRLSLRKRAQRTLTWLVGRFAQDRIVAVSEPLAVELRASFGASRVCVIDNGLAMDGAIEEPPRNLSGPLRVGFAGRLAPVKRVDLFLKIAAAVLAQNMPGPHPEFHIYGDGPLRDTLEKQALDAGMANSVCFHGHIDNAEPAIAALDVLVICSDHEGLPMAALEAMKHHTLVLTHPIGGLPRLLGDGSYGYLAASQGVSDFVAAISDINDNRHMLCDKTALAYRHFVGNYSAENMAQQHLRLYQQLTENNG